MPKRTTIIMGGLAAFLIGLGLARLHVQVSWLIVLGFFIFALFSFRLFPKFFLMAIVGFGLVLGVYRGSNYMHKLRSYDGLAKQQVTLQAIVVDDGVYAEQSQLGFTASSIKVLSPKHQNLVGQLSVEGFGASMVYRGDTVQISGKIYPTRGSKQGTIKFAQIKLMSHQETTLEKVRHKFISGMYNALPEPLASFALGLLLGQRTNLPVEITAVLTATGLTHIIAVSGYNLTIIVRATQRLFSKRSRYQTTIVSLALVFLFVLLVGSSPSIMRASIVSLLSIVAWYYGRNIKPLLLILLVAAATAAYNPIYIWSDIGWYLSFLAFFGVMIIAPLVIKRIYKDRQPRTVVLICIETICAQIMTVPIILFVFGQTSWLAIVANILVVPLVPVGMLLSLIAGIFGMWLPSVAGFVALPAKVILTYMLDVATLISKIPGVVVERSISAKQMIILYAILLAICILLWHKNRGNGIITDKKVSQNVRT